MLSVPLLQVFLAQLVEVLVQVGLWVKGPSEGTQELFVVSAFSQLVSEHLQEGVDHFGYFVDVAGDLPILTHIIRDKLVEPSLYADKLLDHADHEVVSE